MKTALLLLFAILVIAQGMLLHRVQRQCDELIVIAKDSQHLARQWETAAKSFEQVANRFERSANDAQNIVRDCIERLTRTLP